MKSGARIRNRLIRSATVLGALLLLSATKSSNAPRVLDWGALGSGCRSRPSEQSDVTFLEPVVRRDGAIYQFLLGKYGLDGNKPITSNEPAFARDCSIRLVVQPPAGMRLRTFSAESRFRINKSSGFSFQVASSISTPRAQMGVASFLYDTSQTLVDSDATVRVVPSQGESKGDLGSQCDEARVLGLDIALSSDRKSFDQKVAAILAGDQRVTLEVWFESCSKDGKN